MNFYTNQHQYYCGVDLHARTLHVCILDQLGEVLVHRGIPATPEAFLRLVKPYREDLVVGAECMFTWYWLADWCLEHEIHFVLGHALYMKAIHGGKTKNDKIDSDKIARLLRGGTMPQAYVYPSSMRSTRDLLRRRMYLVHKRAELLAHIQNTNSQYNLAPFGKKLAFPANRRGVAERFTDLGARKSVEVDLAMLEQFDPVIQDLELYLVRHAKVNDPQMYFRLQTVKGVGKALGLVLMYEIHDINRFPRVQDFVSYSRLVKCEKTSAGKSYGHSGNKIGNAHLKWAFSEAACLFMRASDQAKKFVAKREQKHGKGKAMGILAAKMGRSVYQMLRKGDAFDEKVFFAN